MADETLLPGWASTSQVGWLQMIPLALRYSNATAKGFSISEEPTRRFFSKWDLPRRKHKLAPNLPAGKVPELPIDGANALALLLKDVLELGVVSQLSPARVLLPVLHVGIRRIGPVSHRVP